MKQLLLIIGIALVPFCSIQAQESNEDIKKKLEITIKNNDNPDVYIDGKKYDHAIVELLDTDKIATISVLKDEQALKRYNAPNGVILIETKSKKEDQVKIRFKDGNNNETQPLIIIDGIKAEKGDMEKLDPIDIASVEVLKGENAMKKYNAPNGVVIITTKE
ncbi:TonB-dependent receptor plug domain-containing protein [Cyclobacterium sp. 1_MG-2023]|uniref:TonB-dependent receptor plug domain-containing protein n=1 Tax=Cyclobacterium sp. 1_MG-2023 TaxID=3062681 RepID=UPI0026E2FC92|nr:TonB-dependent receptor plug domain-containing protein [Cyclobacterium sp. 1_MG-2023]MDO6439293.1 TonB-dependent receptor plug domain-containing protein [Cyclobacterium sp. 1_MG-2023]